MKLAYSDKYLEINVASATDLDPEYKETAKRCPIVLTVKGSIDTESFSAGIGALGQAVASAMGAQTSEHDAIRGADLRDEADELLREMDDLDPADFSLLLSRKQAEDLRDAIASRDPNKQAIALAKLEAALAHPYAARPSYHDPHADF